MSNFAARAARTAAVFVAALAAAPLTAQAKLRNPQQSVFAAFPAADGYQAIVRTIDQSARSRIEKCLPFRVHFNELGEHTIYVALRDRVPLGMVYVLCEEETFGLTEVRWAITLDMRLAGFEFQRTRSRQRESVEKSEFVRLLHGRSAAELTEMLGADGLLKPNVRGIPVGSEELAAALARSALKALTVVDEVWVTEVTKLHDLALGTRAFPTAQRFTRVWPPSGDAPAPDAEDPVRVDWIVRATGREALHLGTIAQVSEPARALTWTWTLDAAGRVVDVEGASHTQSGLRSGCLDAIGRELSHVCQWEGEVGRSAQALTRRLQPRAEPPK